MKNYNYNYNVKKIYLFSFCLRVFGSLAHPHISVSVWALSWCRWGFWNWLGNKKSASFSPKHLGRFGFSCQNIKLDVSIVLIHFSVTWQGCSYLPISFCKTCVPVVVLLMTREPKPLNSAESFELVLSWSDGLRFCPLVSVFASMSTSLIELA